MTIDHPALGLLSRLLDVSSVSGNEAAMATLIRAMLDEHAIPHTTDAAGNVLVRLAGRNANAPLVCLAAHMDEIGMIVSRIDDDGGLRVTRSGGLYPYKLGEGPLEIFGDHATLLGVLSMGSTHRADAAERALTWADVRVSPAIRRRNWPRPACAPARPWPRPGPCAARTSSAIRPTRWSRRGPSTTAPAS